MASTLESIKRSVVDSLRAAGPEISTLGELVAARSMQNLSPQAFATAGVGGVAEHGRPSGSFLLDELVGGLIPGGVTVVRASWEEIALAAVAELVIAVTPARSVLLTAPSASIPALLDVLTARATRMTIEEARIHDLGRAARETLAVYQAMDELPVSVALDASTPDAARAARQSVAQVELIVALYADAGGTRCGDGVLPAWRALAAELGVPVIVHVSGRGYGWAEPEDAHIELAHTHIGGYFAWVDARGVAPHEGPERQLALRLNRDHGALGHRDDAGRGEPPPRCIERSWRGDVIETPLGRWGLAKRMADPEWTPVDAAERHDVLVSLGMTAFDEPIQHRATEPPWWRDADTLLRVVQACGGLDAWTRVLLAVGADRDRGAWSRLERSFLPRVELPDDAPRAWSAARRVYRHARRAARV